jgi:hypothetical protein
VLFDGGRFAAVKEFHGGPMIGYQHEQIHGDKHDDHAY